ncbi:MAG: hypothetical protein EOM58_08000 [Clostridia bacterium]|nr:hypothetical protein [Clostridia bacterium]
MADSRKKALMKDTGTKGCRCHMCPEPPNSASLTCTLIKPDLITGVAYPCKFVRAYTDGARLLRICWNERHQGYKVHALREADSAWTPVPSKYLPWKVTFDQAQAILNRYATRKGWRALGPGEVAEE